MALSARKQTHPVVIFLVIVFAMGWTFQFAGADIFLIFAAWAPAIAVLAIGRRGADVWIGLGLVRWRWCLIGAGLGGLPFVLVQFLFWLTSLGVLNNSMFVLSADGGVAELRGGHFLLGNGAQTFWWFALNLLLTAVVGGVLATLIGALQEEIGWRGFLQPRVAARFGVLRGLLLVGVIVCIWHLPSAGIGALMYVGLAFTLGWLRLRSGAVWPCAVALGFFNTLSGLQVVVVPGFASLFCVLLMGGWFAWRLAVSEANPAAPRSSD